MSKGKEKTLEERVKHLEDQIDMLITIADDEKKPFIYLALESGLSHDQVKKILDLMDNVRTSLKTKPMGHVKFESEIFKIVPSHDGDYKFAETIILTLNDEHRYTDVYQHMKKDGMNLE
jgi:hypothetical protein